MENLASFSVAFALFATALRTYALPLVYVPNADDGTVSIIDDASQSVVSIVTVGHNPTGVSVNPAGTRVYVTNKDDGTVSVVDTSLNATIATIAVGAFPYGVTVDGTGQRVYIVSSTNPGSLVTIDATTNLVVDAAPVGGFPRGVALRPGMPIAYVTNTYDGRERRPCDPPLYFCDITLSVVDVSADVEASRIVLGDDLRGVAVNATGTRVYVGNIGIADDPGVQGRVAVVSVIDTSTNEIVRRIALDGSGFNFVFDPSEEHLFTQTTDGIGIIDTATNTVQGRVRTALLPAGLSITPDGQRIYVAQPNDNLVAVVDTKTLAVVARIPVGRRPVAFGQFIGPETIGGSPTPPATSSPTPTATSRSSVTSTPSPKVSSSGGGSGCAVDPGASTPLVGGVLAFPALALLLYRKLRRNLRTGRNNQPFPAACLSVRVDT